MFCAEIVERIFTSFHIYLITLGKDVTFPLITKFKTNRSLSYEYRIKMRLTDYVMHDINKTVLNLYFHLSFSSVNSIILYAHHLLSDYFVM